MKSLLLIISPINLRTLYQRRLYHFTVSFNQYGLELDVMFFLLDVHPEYSFTLCYLSE